MFNHLVKNELDYQNKIVAPKKGEKAAHKRAEEEKTRAYCICNKVRPAFTGIYIGKCDE